MENGCKSAELALFLAFIYTHGRPNLWDNGAIVNRLN